MAQALANAIVQKMKDDHHASWKQHNGDTSKVGRDGIIESDSEDEKVVKKRKSPVPVDTKREEGKSEGKDEGPLVKAAKTSQSSSQGRKVKPSAA